MAAWENAELHDAICNADLVIPDGIGVVKAARIIGTPLKERLPGIEIGEAILEYAAQTGKSVFLLGAKPGVADAAKKKCRKRTTDSMSAERTTDILRMTARWSRR